MPETSAVAGYSGVTASGAGFTGTVPVIAAPASSQTTADYNAVISETPVTDYSVTETRLVFTDTEAGVIEARPESELSRYAKEWDIGPTSDLVTAESAMTIIKDFPNVVFPFEVEGQKGQRRIELDGVYDLNNVRASWLDGDPVQVVQLDTTSFTFNTLPGHFRGPDRTIRFETLERNGRLILRQEGTSANGLFDELYDAGAQISWRYQADNLRAAIYGGSREDFPPW